MNASTAVIAGVGPGLGASIAEKFLDEGLNVATFSRSGESLGLEKERGKNTAVLSLSVDISSEEEIERGFERVREEFGGVDVLVNHASDASWKDFEEIDAEDFEKAWQVDCLGSFLCTQEAVQDMKSKRGGVILFTGATSAVRGNPDAVGFASAKYAKRGLADSLARALGPEGIHVAHVVIDGMIDTPRVRDQYGDMEDEELLDPDEIAESYWSIVEQDKSAWTNELDLRPHVEEF